MSKHILWWQVDFQVRKFSGELESRSLTYPSLDDAFALIQSMLHWPSHKFLRLEAVYD